MDEKRSFDRYALWFPVTVDAVSPGGASPSMRSDGGEPKNGDGHLPLWAVCRDASAGGLLLAGSHPLEVGAAVTVRFRVSPEGAERKISGRVVRVELSDDNPRSVWPYRVAVEFLEPDVALQAMFARASSRPPPPPSAAQP